VIYSVLALPNGLSWIDVCAPTAEDFKRLVEQYGLHPTSVKDCLDPKHLPKYEKIGSKKFVILRQLDEKALKKSKNDTVVELTRKIAFFLDEKSLITIHRKDTALLQMFRERWSGAAGSNLETLFPVVVDLFREIILSFELALQMADMAFENFEVRIFNNLAEDLILEDMYFLKRRVSVYRRVLRQTLDVVPKLNESVPAPSPFVQDLKEEAERLHGWAEENAEDVSALLNTHISLASHRTSEIVRVLTLFSVFFMPLTFIVGVYGMNFKFMPELEWRGGYPAVWATMGAIVVALFWWFRRRGWLR
jgi:magnesium transporter